MNHELGILVGEDADLPKSVMQDLPVRIFPFIVDWKGYGAMRSLEDKEFPKTSQPSIKTFEKFFAQNLKEFKELLVITISSSLSGTYNSAMQAKKLLEKNEQKRVHIIDSKTSTGAEALIVLKVAQLIKLNERVSEILLKLNRYIGRTYLLGVFDDPKWLKKGGRINSLQAIVIRNMLKTGFRPILTIKDGKIVTKKIQMNARDKTTALFSQFKEEVHDKINSNKHISVAITHADCERDAIKLKNLVANYNKNITIKFVNEISPVVGAHLGPDSLIISWAIV
ncbi:MAG: DegV family protein [Patescibacteria group bacterium]